jgi:hypothetical protein
MSKYLLLRNNKQTGPHSLEEIRAMQLKAYDLVWVDGKSAAWRYPGELEELKAFAPPVEEQPFDRFFKKPTPTSEQPAPIALSAASREKENSRQGINASEHKAASPNNPIYVNLPNAKKATIEWEADPVRESDRNKPLSPKELIATAPAQEPKSPIQKSFSRSIPAAALAEVPVGLEEKYSQPLDEIKRQYAEKVLGQKRHSPKNANLYAKPVFIGFGVITLLAAGILIGLSINKGGNNSTPKGPTKDQIAISDQPTDYHPRTYRTSSALPVDPKNVDNTNASGEDQSALDKKQADAAARRKAKAARKMADTTQATKVIASPDSGILAAKIETPKKSEIDLAKDAIRNNIGDYVFLSANKYSVGTFGGISELQLTVSNRSVYPLDLVVVEVQYIQSNKKIFKTENLYFHSVGGGSALMQEAPSSPRGVKVQYRITIINSKDLGLAYTSL